jgi:hypothetical protein
MLKLTLGQDINIIINETKGMRRRLVHIELKVQVNVNAIHLDGRMVLFGQMSLVDHENKNHLKF